MHTHIDPNIPGGQAFVKLLSIYVKKEDLETRERKHWHSLQTHSSTKLSLKQTTQADGQVQCLWRAIYLCVLLQPEMSTTFQTCHLFSPLTKGKSTMQ